MIFKKNDSLYTGLEKLFFCLISFNSVSEHSFFLNIATVIHCSFGIYKDIVLYLLFHFFLAEIRNDWNMSNLFLSEKKFSTYNVHSLLQFAWIFFFYVALVVKMFTFILFFDLASEVS